jgi:hypothetical protein
MTRPASSFLAVWRWPIGLALLTLFGLLSALLGQHGIWHGLSWAALAIPLAVITGHIVRAERAARNSPSRTSSR